MRTKKGVIVSAKMDKTVAVVVHRYVNHPKYKKRYRVSNKFYAHDPKNALEKGMFVKIAESKPISKLKKWKVVKVYEDKNQDNSSVEIKGDLENVEKEKVVAAPKQDEKLNEAK